MSNKQNDKKGDANGVHCLIDQFSPKTYSNFYPIYLNPSLEYNIQSLTTIMLKRKVPSKQLMEKFNNTPLAEATLQI